jgi:L-alanine-DL-glutamate epimerase-like enolase superfamily enzyme
MPVPAGPGIGVDVVRERVEQYTISCEEFSA